jgi:hypothetical protein
MWMALGAVALAGAVGVWTAAVALGSPAFSAPALTKLPVALSWSDSSATGFTLSRTAGTCAAPTGPEIDLPLTAGQSSLADSPADGRYCYAVTGTYLDATPPRTAKDVWVDNAPPTVPAFSAAIFSGAILHGSVPVAATSSDGASGSGVVSTVITIDGGAFASGAGSASGTWSTSGSGAHTVTATATDAAGNVASASAAVTVDDVPPAAPSVSALQSPVAGKPTLLWQNVAGETYTVSRGGGPASDPATSPWTDPATLAPGTYGYVVTATDAAGNQASSAAVPVIVISPGLTQPRAFSASSPTRSVPHLTWQAPITFAVTGWQVYRDGAPLQTISDPAAGSYDDASAVQGPHTYAVQALSGGTVGELSSAIAVTYDTVAPALDGAVATANANGTVAVSWPAATDPAPGSGIAGYVVRRGAGSSAPPDPASGTAVCTAAASDTGCTDAGAKSGTLYGYAVFALDAAGNVARREASAKALDTLSPDAVTGLQVVSSDRTYVRLGWSAPALKGADEDLAGYRVLLLRPGAKAPLNPGDGTVVCMNDDPQDTLCDSLDLTTGKKVAYAVYAYDEVPNYSAPVLISAVPHSLDTTPPHRPTKVTLTHAGLRYTLKWVTPRDPDLSKFRVVLYPKRPSPRPAVGKAVATGRVLHASFTLTPGQRVYVNLFALDVSGNFSRVSMPIAAPERIARRKHVVRKAAKPKASAPKKKKKPAVAKKPAKPVSVTIA